MNSRTFKCEGERNDHMLHYERVFGNLFERRESKCCAVLMKNCCKAKGEQVITLQIAQQLKTKNISVVQDNYFVVSVKLHFFRDRLIVLMVKINFNLLQMLAMNSLNFKHQGKAPINFHFICQLTPIYENFKEQYFRSMQSTF